ncbi:TetR/AcrR family transcriptional regulator [Pendulispora albinea]|uniref:TetR/AcrR family transcriptional regulator n=1 Tax=Pendulispora albinea TaxID=2741071 RepID=A0ABZ2LLV4_9BACT
MPRPKSSGPTTSTKGEAARERIILATVACIERLGIEGTGVREIAEEANVNGAAINYHFRSKDNLLGIVLERTLDEAFSQVLVDFDALVQGGASPRAALESVFDDAVGGAIRYPRITYAHLREPIVEQYYEGAVMRRLNDFIDGLTRRLFPKRSEQAERRARMALAQMWSVVMISGLLPRFFHQTGGVELENPEMRRQFVAQLVRLVFSDEPAVSERHPHGAMKKK